MTDVGTTPRKPLTPRQRLALFEEYKGLCCICHQPIRGKWIDEHLRALGLGGTNKWDNRGPAHKACADAKTHGPDGDLARIHKAKNQKMAHLGIKNERRRKIANAPKEKRAPRSVASALPPLPPKTLFVET